MQTYAQEIKKQNLGSFNDNFSSISVLQMEWDEMCHPVRNLGLIVPIGWEDNKEIIKPLEEEKQILAKQI